MTEFENKRIEKNILGKKCSPSIQNKITKWGKQGCILFIKGIIQQQDIRSKPLYTSFEIQSKNF